MRPLEFRLELPPEFSFFFFENPDGAYLIRVKAFFWHVDIITRISGSGINVVQYVECSCVFDLPFPPLRILFDRLVQRWTSLFRILCLT